MLLDGALRGPAAVVIDDEVIVDVLDRVPPDGPDHLRLPDGVLSPGLVDLQVNGGQGVDLVSALPEGWEAVAMSLPRTGVTSYLATFITAPLPVLVDALGRAATARHRLAMLGGARLLGVHLEGPWIAAEQAGAHDPSLMSDPTPADVRALLAGDRGLRVLAMVTLAPERMGALSAVAGLVAHGVVVSIGHSDATAEQTKAAADAGATMVTHLFNAQRGLHHREPGVAGHALVDERLTLGLIADGHHVHPEVLSLTLRAAGPRVALVTDAAAPTGAPRGDYSLGGASVTIDAQGLPRRDDGTLAGSTLRMDDAVRMLVDLGIDPTQALRCASTVPADVLGRDDLGRIAVGAAADLVWWSDDLVVRRTWVAGAPVHP